MAEGVPSEVVIDMDAQDRPTTPLTDGDTREPSIGVSGVTFTVRDAARACAVHANTVRRRLKSGEFPNAFRDRSGTWRIPVVDLEAAGLRPQRPSAPAPEAVVVIPEASPTGMPTLRETYEALQMVEAEADALREEVQELTRRAAFAETIAQERADRIDDLRIALRALEAMNPTPEERLAQMRAPLSTAPADLPSDFAAGPSGRRPFWRRRS